MAVFVISCAGPVSTGDPWQGMTPAEYADHVWDKPDKKIPTGLSRSEKKALMQMLEVGAMVGGAVVTGAFKSGLIYKMIK